VKIHMAKLVRSAGAVIALCGFAQRVFLLIDLRRVPWTNQREAVTCGKCRKLLLRPIERKGTK
jgi:hypothetical protein